ncbi:MAG: hypothetical protein QM767_22135 [Anaeromyxobacter sp.]
MKRSGWMVMAAWLVVGCGTKDDKPNECDSQRPCEAGQYCAQTPDGNVCWPDTVAPRVNAVTTTCSTTPCLRDSVLTVAVAATDDHQLARVELRMDLDHDRLISLTQSNGKWVTTLALAEWPFPDVEHVPALQVLAYDAADNERNLQMSTALVVTRALFSISANSQFMTALTPSALLSDGTVVVGGADGKAYFFTSQGAAVRPSVPVGTAPLSVAPAVAPDAIWFGSADGSLYSLEPDGTSPRACPVGTLPVAAAAIVGQRAIAGSEDQTLVVADSGGACVPMAVDGSVTAAPLVANSGGVLVAAGGKLHNYTLRNNGTLFDNWTSSPAAPAIGDSPGPLALGTADSVWSTAALGQVVRTSSAAEAVPLATLPPAAPARSSSPTAAPWSALPTARSAACWRAARPRGPRATPSPAPRASRWRSARRRSATR